MTADDERLIHAIADHLATYTYLTHTDRDTIARAFTAGWHAHAGGEQPGAHRAEADEPALIQVGTVLYELAQTEHADGHRVLHAGRRTGYRR
jgi:hypothetical protein